jgi:ankyrin repeat protein
LNDSCDPHPHSLTVPIPILIMPASRKNSAPTTRSKKANSTKAAAKAAAPAKTAEQIAQEEHDALVTSASKLIHAVTYAPVDEVKKLLKEGAPTWYQEESTGWNCLHFAAERGDADVVKACLGSGAVWNAGEQCSLLGFSNYYTLLFYCSRFFGTYSGRHFSVHQRRKVIYDDPQRGYSNR